MTTAALAASSPFVLTFAGQATPWVKVLEDLLALDKSLAARLREVDERAAALLTPVATQLLTIRPAGNRLLGESGLTTEHAGDAHTSVPGIVLTQHALLASLPAAGLSLADHRPAAVLGHSQGVLASALLELILDAGARLGGEGASHDGWVSGSAAEQVAALHALARLIGAAATRVTRDAGLGRRGEATPMMSIRGLSRTQVEELLGSLSPQVAQQVTLGVANGPAAHIVCGHPAALEAVARAAAALGEKSAAARKARQRGGAVLAPITEFLDTAVPFHTAALAPAVELTVSWAAACGLDEILGAQRVRDLAAHVLTDHVDWPHALTAAVQESGARLVLDLGPGDVLGRLNRTVLAGTGVALASAGTAAALDDLDRPGVEPVATLDRSRFAPRLVRLPDGTTKLSTAFTRLTGRSAVLLAGMTPTTVDPAIVAAAANAGYWAELAGGGQTTPEVLDKNLHGLADALEPGRTAAFNAMFMDRYLWNLHLGTQRLLSKARAAGSPVDGVVISAGIPEREEAVALVERLRAEGFEYVAFKPGTVEQIRQVLAIAKEIAPTRIIMQVEDGHAGGHHSWEDLDTMLLATYDDVRRCENVVLAVGGGIGTPERAADYLTGTWARAYHTPDAPVDAVMVGTAVMTAKEACTTPEVKQLLVDTPGITPGTPGAVDGWVASGASAGGMTSGLSHLRADLYEIDNSSARASRLIQEVAGDLEAITARREEVITALGATAKPYFGDLDSMTYLEWATRYAELCVSPHAGRPATEDDWVEAGWYDRFLDLLHRIEARLNPADHGQIPTIFPAHSAVIDADAALAALAERYPAAATTLVEPADVAWWPELCRKHPRPVPFVPVLDADILRWWGTDSLWQSQDPRYSADQVRIIPGPVSVAGVTTMDEPVAQILGRFEQAAFDAVTRLGGPVTEVAGRLGEAADVAALVRKAPHLLWNGHLMANPARVLGEEAYSLTARPDLGSDTWDLDITLDTHWDAQAAAQQGKHAAGSAADLPYAVRRLLVPLRVAGAATGAVPVVDSARVGGTMTDLLRATAGVGSTSATGDVITALPTVTRDGQEGREWGTVHDRVHLAPSLGGDHASVTADALPAGQVAAPVVPDALLGPCWPVVYAALGSVVEEGMPLIEGLLGAVHLDHCTDLRITHTQLAALMRASAALSVTGWVAAMEDSSAGRVVDVRLELRLEEATAGIPAGTLIAAGRERFAVRGRARSTQPPSAAFPAGNTGLATESTARRLLRRVTVQAPADMTAFARVTGDYNPIHTSYHAARVAGMEAPLVHGMWLSATAQQVVASAGGTGRAEGWQLRGWTYVMLGTVDLLDEIEISVERTGVVRGGGLALEVICRKGDEVVSRATALTEPLPTAYVYPGQGIQAAGMGLDEMASSPAARAVWERADAHTRAELGFSVIALVRDNPTELTARGVTYRHPEGLLHLTQFTQVALATVAMASTERLREAGVLVEGAAFAGHSLGEYTALASYGGIMDIETTISIVFQRGSTMHTLVERDATGASGYRMGALRPDQAGISASEVEEYVAGIAQRTGEFLQIVNYNLAGSQYAVAGTVAGLEALTADARAKAAARGGKNPIMLVPGIDVPFHSSVLRPGVPEFRERLRSLLPQQIDVERLEGRYVPNLVARPFALTRDFAEAILDVVPSEPVRGLLEHWDEAITDRTALARTLLIELLAWQFASPVRWIETQDVLVTAREAGGLGIADLIEVGLAASPTLANLAARTLALPQHAGASVSVFNVRRDEARVLATDTDPAVTLPDPEPSSEGIADAAASPSSEAAPSSPAGGAEQAAPAATEPASATGAPASTMPVSTGSGEPAADLPYDATDALTFLLCYAARLAPEQISVTDTTESLTGGVSSRRNQLLMDLGAELELASIDGAADADMPTLSGIVASGAPGYRAFGPVLSDVVRTSLAKILGPAGARASRVADRVRGTWGLTEGWVAHVTATLVLGTREGSSVRGGDLTVLSPATPANASQVDALIDAAVQAVATAHGVAVSMPSAGGAGGGTMVDSAALDAFSAAVTGENGALATTARALLAALGLGEAPLNAADPEAIEAADAEARTRALVEAVDAELGSGWLASVTPAFDARRAVLLDDRWASAREDLARLASGELTPTDPALDPARYVGLGQAVAEQASYWAGRLEGEAAARAAEIAQAAARKASEGEASRAWAGEVAVVTGMAPGSIAAAVTAGLLAGGATVVATASRVNDARLAFAKELYRRHAVAGAQLWLVPANLASYRDVDALAEWIASDQTLTAGGTTTLVKPALTPTLLFPFAAPRVSGTLADAGGEAEKQTRVLLWSLERQIARLAAIGTDTAVDHRLHVVLPGSPNRGTFGGDGAYGEVKSAFDAIVNRWHAETAWSRRVSLAHPRIGWVRGTGLMGGNDPLVAAVESQGVRTWSTEEIADQLLNLAIPATREQAATAPVLADLTGGLGERHLDMGQLRATAARLAEEASPTPATAAGEAADQASSGVGNETGISDIAALPTPTVPTQPTAEGWGEIEAGLENMVVMISAGEISTWGTGRTRREAELGIGGDSVDLTAAGVLELAWGMGLLTWADSPHAGWYDAEGNLVPEEQIWERYRDEVAARCGIREMSDDGVIAPDAEIDESVYLDSDVTFTVASEALARSLAAADPAHTVICPAPGEAGEAGEWQVTRQAGSLVRVPRRATLSRRVGGQMPEGFDPARWGIPASMLEGMDTIAAWNLVTAVEAFLAAGFTPAELLRSVHPSLVASTQGTGFGGMESMRKMFVGRLLDEERPSDILQEALPNVVAAHVMQSFIGGYGSMVQPVSACATAAVSIEEAWDKIALGKADVVVAGAIDDISIESVVGFGNMNATAATDEMYAKGISARRFSRANDRRRSGFVEAEGGGTVILARASVAAELGLPVAGVVGFVSSYADGAHTSIPAPGMGALGAGRGGAASPLARALGRLGVAVDDVAVISKHDTSTKANDPNESELHTRLAAALGRSAGNPLVAVSQKSVTGHAKGGAALFQIAGLAEILATGVAPGNASLDVVDPALERDAVWVWPKSPIRLTPARGGVVRAGLLTSLGFGHVSGLIALVHPGAFEQALRQAGGEAAVAAWLARANERLAAGARRRRAGMIGREELFSPVTGRRLPEEGSGRDAHEVEAAMLLDPAARLGENGTF